nr:CCAAT/enhancer-binding protein zeta [Leptinotarsa decemlineata]
MKKPKGKTTSANSSAVMEFGNDFTQEQEEMKKWYEELGEDPKSFSKSTEQVLIDLKDEAKKCHDAEVANYNIKNSKTNSNYQWMKTVMSKGTVSDKIAAHVVSIQDNPIANLETIRNLVGMVKVSKKKECVKVMETLTELFLSDLLRPGQKLKPFHQRPLSKLNDLSSGNAVTRRKILSFWYFEDQLKEIYTSFVLALNTVAHDTVDSNKDKAITAMYKLLADNPEQEKNLLTYIINKLGDPSQKVASKVIYCLTQLLFKHINMQVVVLNEIEKLMFRPNISSRAQYYGLCLLSQYHLSHDTDEVARKLIELYFSFFKSCVKTGDVDSRMMSALLMGMNRAYPYAKMDYPKVSEHIDTMYRLVHMANFNISLHALALLYQVSDFGNNISDRFYGALYKKLFDTHLLKTTHQAMLLSLVYKALLKDKEINRVKMFVKRLLQISLYTQPSFSCGILYLISQLLSKKENVLSLTLSQLTIDGLDEDDDDFEEKYGANAKDQVDASVQEIKEEVEDPDFSQQITEVNDSTVIDGDPIEIKEEDEDVKPDIQSLENSGGSWHHLKIAVKKEKSPTSKYNPFARNPLYGGGEFCAYTELRSLVNHFHPTVSLFAYNILNGERINYTGDPLKDFTLIRFLERFVFKNPRKVEEKPGKHPTFGKRKLYRPKGIKMIPVKSANYVRENPENIPVDELFVHTYLQQKYQEKDTEDNEDSDLESVQSEEFEEMLDKMAGVREADDSIDYMNEIGDNLNRTDKKNKKKTSDEEEEGSEGYLSDQEEMDDDLDDDDLDDEELDDEEGDIDEEEFDENDEELLGDLSDDDDVEDMEFMDEEPSNKKRNKFKKRGDDIMSQFASAEEFATLLDEEGSSRVKPGGSNVFANKDHANTKQLAWEENRNRWIKGFSRAVGGKSSREFSQKNKEFPKKRKNNNKFKNTNKKFKK